MKNEIKSFSGEFRYLSNFWELNVPIERGGIKYPTVEHAYQAAKTDDVEQQKYIASLSTPGQAKRKGAELKLIDNWNTKKVAIMSLLVLDKFRKNPDLRKLLLDTGTADLIEGNNWGDKFWGVCNGEGENMLGKILMDIRERLKNPVWE